MTNDKCEKCKGEGRYKDKDGSIHTCFDCLLNGQMDQHETKLKSADELRIKI
jgi:hypothetical protein